MRPAEVLPQDGPEPDELSQEILVGLAAQQKRLPGHRLGGGLTAAYPARVERALLAESLPDVAEITGPAARLIEARGGDTVVLDGLPQPAVYIPIDPSAARLARLAALVRSRQPALAVRPVQADPTRRFSLPAAGRAWRRTLVSVAGSTLAPLVPDIARALLARLARLAGPEALLLVGADATRDRETLLDAYAADPAVLRQVNTFTGADFDVDDFEPTAEWNEPRSRVELHLVSRRAHLVDVNGWGVMFRAGEGIVTEHSHKHTPAAFSALLEAAGWRPLRRWVGVPAMSLWLAERA